MDHKSERARRAAERSVDLVVVATVAALLLGLLSTLALTARLLRPLGVLSGTVRRIAEGDLEARALVHGKDEIAALALEFNGMADRLPSIAAARWASSCRPSKPRRRPSTASPIRCW